MLSNLDYGYSPQFSTISRLGHTSATAEFGSPTLVWHVAFWPKRKNDPFSIATTENGKVRSNKDIIEEFARVRSEVVKDFNQFLERIQARGRHPAAARKQQPFQLIRPSDWDAETEPFKVFETGATSFTLWWPDKPAAPGPDALPDNVMSDRPAAQPVRTDLRVQVLAEASIDYSTITFFVDAGKPWREPPIYLSDDNPHGDRRQKVFGHVRNIKTICEERLNAVDHEGKRLIDLDLLPEPNPICGTAQVALAHGFTDCATALKAAADYLYDEIWDNFCTDFGFETKQIAGDTDVIFAEFRGLVMPSNGTEMKDGNLARAQNPPDLAETSHPGSQEFHRFDGEGTGYDSEKLEPNAVVKAYMPFMRRFRAEADWRDWIACGIFDWRAIFINPVGSKSEFSAFDDWDYDRSQELPSAIPAGQIPQRTSGRPAPFRYLLLTKFEPNRKQVGRMVERVNTLGTRRLFALKAWSVIQNASVWINHYGRQLDAAYAQWISDAEKLQDDAYQKKAQKSGNLKEEEEREIDGDRDRELAEINRAAEKALIVITRGLDELGVGAVGGLPYRIAKSRDYADTFRAAREYLREGNIETWWSYEQVVKRGMEPVLTFIEGVGARLDKLRTRLQATKQDILESSIALQTEATRYNTYKLERIQAELKVIAEEATKSSRLMETLRRTQLITSAIYYLTMVIYTSILIYLIFKKL
jgi:hypothetical protein